MYRRIIVPVQGSQLDTRAIDLAAVVSNRNGGTDLTLVYVVEVPQELPLDADLPHYVEQGEAILQTAEKYVRSASQRWHRVMTELLQARSAAAAIVDEAIERAADAIVLSTINQYKWGVTSQGETVPYILKNAPCDVVMTRVLGDGGEIR